MNQSDSLNYWCKFVTNGNVHGHGGLLWAHARPTWVCLRPGGCRRTPADRVRPHEQLGPKSWAPDGQARRFLHWEGMRHPRRQPADIRVGCQPNGWQHNASKLRQRPKFSMGAGVLAQDRASQRGRSNLGSSCETGFMFDNAPCRIGYPNRAKECLQT